MGYIYILTNPSFDDYVKIGYADDYKKRLKELNRSECTPFAFRVYAVYEVDNRLTDMKLHAIIDKLNPDLRSIDNIDGKKRVREFYKMTKEDAYSLFEAIAEINGRLEKLKLIEATKKEVLEEELAKDVSESIVNYTEEYHTQNAEKDTISLYNKLKSILCSEFKLDVKPCKKYISFKKNGKNIVDIRLMTNKIKIWFNAHKGELVDVQEYTRDISEVGHWGNGDYEALISNEKELPYIKSLIEQVYSKA